MASDREKYEALKRREHYEQLKAQEKAEIKPDFSMQPPVAPAASTRVDPELHKQQRGFRLPDPTIPLKAIFEPEKDPVLSEAMSPERREKQSLLQNILLGIPTTAHGFASFPFFVLSGHAHQGSYLRDLCRQS